MNFKSIGANNTSSGKIFKSISLIFILEFETLVLTVSFYDAKMILKLELLNSYFYNKFLYHNKIFYSLNFYNNICNINIEETYYQNMI